MKNRKIRTLLSNLLFNILDGFFIWAITSEWFGWVECLIFAIVFWFYKSIYDSKLDEIKEEIEKLKK